MKQNIIKKLKSQKSYSVGVLAADMMNLSADIQKLEQEGISLLHFDVMDTSFTNSLTVGDGFIKSIKTNMLKDVHLMIDRPEDKVNGYLESGAGILTAHLEAMRHPYAYFSAIDNKNKKDNTEILRGVAINPLTPIESLKPYLNTVDCITLLGIAPGFQGQKIDSAFELRITELKKIISEDQIICIDGGITSDNIEALVKFDIDVIVSGSAMFKNFEFMNNVMTKFNKEN